MMLIHKLQPADIESMRILQSLAHPEIKATWIFQFDRAKSDISIETLWQWDEEIIWDTKREVGLNII